VRPNGFGSDNKKFFTAVLITAQVLQRVFAVSSASWAPTSMVSSEDRR
jgi:hypothetical protein